MKIRLILNLVVVVYCCGCATPSTREQATSSFINGLNSKGKDEIKDFLSWSQQFELQAMNMGHPTFARTFGGASLKYQVKLSESQFEELESSGWAVNESSSPIPLEYLQNYYVLLNNITEYPFLPNQQTFVPDFQRDEFIFSWLDQYEGDLVLFEHGDALLIQQDVDDKVHQENVELMHGHCSGAFIVREKRSMILFFMVW